MASTQTRFCPYEQSPQANVSTVNAPIFYLFHRVDQHISTFRWRAFKVIQRIPADQRAVFELKLLAGEYLKERSSFLESSIRQEWKGDYLLLVRLFEFDTNTDAIDLLIDLA